MSLERELEFKKLFDAVCTRGLSGDLSPKKAILAIEALNFKAASEGVAFLGDPLQSVPPELRPSYAKVMKDVNSLPDPEDDEEEYSSDDYDDEYSS